MQYNYNCFYFHISSIGDIVGYPFSAAYCSTKFALEGLSESLSYELEQFGIKVILIEPALVISDFHNNVKMAVKKGAKKTGHKTAEVASKGKAKVTDEVHKDKVGPNGETIYIDNHANYYWVDKKGRRHYIAAAALKNKY